MSHRLLVSHSIIIERQRKCDVQAVGAAAGESDLSDRASHPRPERQREGLCEKTKYTKTSLRFLVDRE